MSSFRKRLRNSVLGLILLLLVLFDALVFWGLRQVLYQYVDGRLYVTGQTWATILSGNGGLLSELGPALPARGPAPPEHAELQEVAPSLRVFSREGRELWRGPIAPQQPPRADVLARVQAGGQVLETVRLDRHSVRRLWIPVSVQGDVHYILQAETPLRLMEKALNGLALLLSVASGLVLVFAWFGSGWLARRALHPIQLLSLTAERVADTSSLETRLVLESADEEFRRLVEAFNRMMDRLQKVFESQRRFVAYAAHEIQTPLTALKGNLEVAFRQSRTAKEYREILVENLSAVERLIKLSRSLITLARLAGREASLPRTPTSLEPLLRELVEELTVLAEDRGVQLRLAVSAAPVVSGHREQLRRVFINLIDNALRHTGRYGSVTLRLSEYRGFAVVEVADTGQGIAEEHLPHLFERFYRADTARARDSGGVGLGLAIVKEIVSAHHGEVEVASRVGRGSTFTVRLPAVPAVKAGRGPAIPGPPAPRDWPAVAG